MSANTNPIAVGWTVTGGVSMQQLRRPTSREEQLLWTLDLSHRGPDDDKKKDSQKHVSPSVEAEYCLKFVEAVRMN